MKKIICLFNRTTGLQFHHQATLKYIPEQSKCSGQMPNGAIYSAPILTVYLEQRVGGVGALAVTSFEDKRNTFGEIDEDQSMCSTV